MKNKEVRTFHLDGDVVEVPIVFDEDIGKYIHDYPDFKIHPRLTRSGRRWVNVTYSECPYADKQYGDCGSCDFFLCEKAGDQIGICTNVEFQQRKDKEA